MGKHTIAVLTENHFGVLVRVSGLFAARGYNIDSVTVGETDDPNVARMTIVANGDDRVVEQIAKQLNKLIDVIKVIELSAEESVLARECALVRVNASAKNRAEIARVAEMFQARTVDISRGTLAFELTGTTQQLDEFINLVRPFGIRETARTGVIAIAKARA